MAKQTQFGEYVRQSRNQRRVSDRKFSVRQVAHRVGIEPSYLSKIERGQQPPPGEETILKLAKELQEDSDELLALAGKVATDVLEVIRSKPSFFAPLLRDLSGTNDRFLVRIMQEAHERAFKEAPLSGVPKVRRTSASRRKG